MNKMQRLCNMRVGVGLEAMGSMGVTYTWLKGLWCRVWGLDMWARGCKC